MLKTMYNLSLDFLYYELRRNGEPDDPLEWYIFVREEDPLRIFPYLMESPKESMATNFYVLFPSPEDETTAILEQREFDPDKHTQKIPFIKPTGSQSPALGPVIKRSYNKAKGGPSENTLWTNITSFERIANEGKEWSGFFKYAVDVLKRPNIKFMGKLYEGDEERPALVQAIEIIPETKTAFLTIIGEDGRLPGEHLEYIHYLQEVIGDEKYATSSYFPVENGIDILTGTKGVIYPNALKGAGINITNVDRIGVFSMLEPSNAWKKYALSVESADLLYIFSYHFRDKFIGRVAGERALILPEVTMSSETRKEFINDFLNYVSASQMEKRVSAREDYLSFLAAEEDSLVGISIIWAKFGQLMENVKGVIFDIMPSRLSALSKLIAKQKKIKSPVFPQYWIEDCDFDLGLNGFANLLKRPGGMRNAKVNNGMQLFKVKRYLAASLYDGQQMNETLLWDEIIATAREYLIEAQNRGNSYGLTNEGVSKSGEAYLTLAGWVRYIASYLDFFRRAGVLLKMNDWAYEPHCDELRKFFKDAEATAGLDTEEKVYAFLIGALFGKLMSIQAARGVNVASNALTWLRRLSLSAKDLPELYVKIREKLFAYQSRGSSSMNAVLEEIGHLGVKIGIPKNLSAIETNYYLLLGQSLSNVLMPPVSKEDIESEEK